MKGRDLAHTQKMFQNDDNLNKARKYNNFGNNMNNMDPNMKHGMMPMYMGYPPMYQNPMYPMPPYQPYQNSMQPYPSYYPPQPYGYYKPQQEG